MSNLSREQQKAGLIAEITAAFDGVSREDGITLHEAQAIDDYAGPEERAETRKLDTETRWQDVPAEDITQGYNVLNFLDPKGFRYYIPAFLIWHLTSEEDSNTYDSIDYYLDRSYKRDESYRLNVSLLTPHQSRAIAHFLVYQAAEHERIQDESDEQRRTELKAEGWDNKRIEEHLAKYRQKNYSQSAFRPLLGPIS